MGEIGIAGIGLAHGYLNRPDLTERAFSADFLGIPTTRRARIYRTGDLGRVNADGEIEHHGRIDTQVKIRGYRIELTEIESVLLRVPGIAQAVVNTHRPDAGCRGAGRLLQPAAGRAPRWTPGRVYADPARAAARVHGAGLPGGAAGHPDAAQRQGRPQEPAPAERSAPRRPPAATTWPRRLTRSRRWPTVLATVLEVDRVSVDGHFFDELGASSLLMARFSAAIRERTALPPVSMKDIYLHPTVRQLAAALGRRPPPAVRRRCRCRRRARQPRPQPASRPSGTPRFFLCGVLQLLAFAACIAGGALLLNAGSAWVVGGAAACWASTRGWWSSAAAGCSASACCPSRSSGCSSAGGSRGAFGSGASPTSGSGWSRPMIVANPMARLFIGTPLYALYLRALGARIGRGVGHPHPARPGLHRPADHRRGQRHPQGHATSAATAPGRG